VWQERLFSLPYREQNRFLETFLSLLAVPYRIGAFLSQKIRENSFKEAFPKPVISIGSVIAGGSGKTTFTQLLAERLERKVAIISHGYRGRKRGKVEDISYGDEAFLLHKKLPGARVFSGKDRVANMRRAVREEVDYLLLDSGMQVKGLHKDLEIAVIHYDNLFRHWHYLPRGLLRESPYNLKDVSFIALQGVRTEAAFHKAKAFLEPYSKAPLFAVNTFVTNGSQIDGKKIAAFTGIGHPERFYQMIEEAGGELVFKKTLPDHASLKDKEAFVREAAIRGADLLLCTEKDLIKLENKEGVTALTIEMRPVFGEEIFTSLCNTIEKLILISHDR
jgi:tetraacyldisaccharide 4'-kinase